MAKVNRGYTDDWAKIKKAPWYKRAWCALNHVKKYKIYPVWDFKTETEGDVKIYGCMKCNIWKKVE